MLALVARPAPAAAAAQQAAAGRSGAGRRPEQAQQQQRRSTQPGNNAPVWREVQRGEPNYTSIPGREMNVLIQPPARFLGQEHRTTAGEAWRQFRNGPITFYGGWLVVLVADRHRRASTSRKGPVKLHDRPTGRMIQRFTPIERMVHWSRGDQLLRPRHHRPAHAVRQARAAAGHRLHAVRPGSPAWARTCTTSSRRSSWSRCWR